MATSNTTIVRKSAKIATGTKSVSGVQAPSARQAAAIQKASTITTGSKSKSGVQAPQKNANVVKAFQVSTPQPNSGIAQQVINDLNNSAQRSGSSNRYSTGKDQQGNTFVKTFTSRKAEESNLRKQGYTPVASGVEGGTIYSKVQKAPPEFVKNTVTPTNLNPKDNTPFTPSQISLNKAIAAQQAREKKYDQPGRVKNFYDKILNQKIAVGNPFRPKFYSLKSVPVAGELTAGAITAPYAIGTSIAPTSEKLYLSGRAFAEGGKYRANLRKENIAAQDVALKEVKGAATFRDPNTGKVTRESIAAGIGVYGGGFFETLTPKVRGAKYGDPKTFADINEIKTKVKTENPFESPSAPKESGVFGFGKQTQTATFEYGSAFSELLSKPRKSVTVTSTSDFALSGTRNIKTGEANFDITGRTKVSGTGRKTVSKRFEAKGVQFQDNTKVVTGIGNADTFSSNTLISRTKGGVVNVPFKRGFGYGGEFELSKPKNSISEKSFFEESKLKKPGVIVREGKNVSESLFTGFGSEKSFTSRKTLYMSAERTSLRKYNEPVLLKENVFADNTLRSKGRKYSSVSKKSYDPFAVSAPSGSYLEAYKRLYGTDLNKPKTVKGVGSVSKDRVYYATLDERPIGSPKRDVLRQKFNNLKLKNNEQFFGGRNNLLGSDKTVLLSKTKESLKPFSGGDVSFFNFGAVTSLKPNTGFRFNFFGGSAIGQNRKQNTSLFTKSSVKNSSLFNTVGPKNKNVSISYQVTTPKYSQSTARKYSYSYFGSTKSVSKKEEQFSPIIPIGNLSAPTIFPRGFGGFGLPGGGLGSSFGGSKKRRKQKTAYNPSLAGLVLGARKNNASLRSEAFGFGVRGV